MHHLMHGHIVLSPAFHQTKIAMFQSLLSESNEYRWPRNIALLLPPPPRSTMLFISSLIYSFVPAEPILAHTYANKVNRFDLENFSHCKQNVNGKRTNSYQCKNSKPQLKKFDVVKIVCHCVSHASTFYYTIESIWYDCRNKHFSLAYFHQHGCPNNDKNEIIDFFIWFKYFQHLFQL